MSTSRSSARAPSSGRRATSASARATASSSTPTATTRHGSAAIDDLQRHPELVHDEELWILFTEDIVRGMGGDAEGSRACAIELVREWERHENFFLYEDALPALEVLRSHELRIGLVSNGQRDLEEFARHHGLDVDVCMGSLAHGRVKPHRSIFEAALAALDARPSESAMVGDSLADDIEGARALGMRAHPARPGRPPRGRARPDRHAARAARGARFVRKIGIRRSGSRSRGSPGCAGGTSLKASASPPHPVWAFSLPVAPRTDLAPAATRRCGPRGARRRAARARGRGRHAPRRARPRDRCTRPRRSKSASHSASVRCREHLRELVAQLFLLRGVLAMRELGPPDEPADRREELGLERRERQVAPVRRLVDPVAGVPAREEAGERIAVEPMRDELVRPVGHRDHEVVPRRRSARARTSAARTSDTARRAPAARSAACTGGRAGAVSARAPAQPR